MSSLLIALQSAYKNVYKVKPYSDVRIYPSIIGEKSRFTKEEKVELTKTGVRWYVYFEYLDPLTGKMKRQNPITLGVNRDFPNFDQRRKRILIIKEEIENLLSNGYSPYPNNTELKAFNIKGAIQFGLELKKNSVNPTTYGDYESRCSKFMEYLSNRDMLLSPVQSLTKKHCNDFLNHISKSSSSRNRNNYLAAIRSVFSDLVSNEIVSVNHFDSIKNLKTTTIRNRSYTSASLQTIIEYLKANDPYLLSFIQLFGYNFLRPVEICRLQCRDIDLSEGILYVRAKNKADKIKRIPDILLNYFQSLDLSNDAYFIFTPNDAPGEWDTLETNKRGYFGKRFAKVKAKLKLGNEYTLYSFRHTFTKKIYTKLIKKHTEQETLERLQLITGHESIAGLKNYLRSIDAKLPEDWSDYLK
jgi:integrase